MTHATIATGALRGDLTAALVELLERRSLREVGPVIGLHYSAVHRRGASLDGWSMDDLAALAAWDEAFRGRVGAALGREAMPAPMRAERESRQAALKLCDEAARILTRLEDDRLDEGEARATASELTALIETLRQVAIDCQAKADRESGLRRGVHHGA